MELFAVPQSVAPRSVTPSHGSHKRRDNNNEMSQQGQFKSSAATDKKPLENALHDSDFDKRQSGLAGLTALARRVKLSQSHPERSIHKQQEARAKMMRQRLQHAYQHDPVSTNQDMQHLNPSERSNQSRRAQFETHMQNEQTNLPHPIHLVV